MKATLATFLLPKWAKFIKLTAIWKLYHEFHARMPIFTQQSPLNAALHETVAPTPWHVHLWPVDSECPVPPTEHINPTEDLHADDLDFIAKKRLADNVSFVVLTEYT
jgi:hypothetical protein